VSDLDLGFRGHNFHFRAKLTSLLATEGTEALALARTQRTSKALAKWIAGLQLGGLLNLDEVRIADALSCLLLFRIQLPK
jgi:hypothetical protein